MRPFVVGIKNSRLRETVESVLDTFERDVLADADKFPMGIIMGDANDANIIVSHDQSSVVGLIDFGDATYTWSILELANALAYGLTTSFGLAQPALAIAVMFSGYCASAQGRIKDSDRLAITMEEIKHLHSLIAVRLCTSVTMGIYSLSQDPGNEYLKLHAIPGRRALSALMRMNPSDFREMLSRISDAACSDTAIDLIALSNCALQGIIPAANVGDFDDEALPVSSFLSTRITFVTGNKKKLEEVISILGEGFPFEVSSLKVDLPELQGAPEDVSREKCRLAAIEVNGPVMTEDTSLCFNALGGLPGVYIKVTI